MDTQVIQIAPDSGGEAIQQAAEALRQGRLVAFPTETVYGVGARADDPRAVRRLRRLKTRQAEKAFTVHIGSPQDADRFVPEMSSLARRFARKAWPGPLTLILPAPNPLATPVMSGLNGKAADAIYYNATVGLRCPDDWSARTLLSAVSAPVVATSANPAGRPPPVTGREVLELLGGQVDLLVDAGRTRYARPSTIVRVDGLSYTLIREGVYDAGILERMSVSRLLLVCTGNTCRSPMAAALARRLLAERMECKISELSSRGISVVSAGTAGGTGAASPKAVAVMARRGIDMSDHLSARLTPQMVQEADHIFTMTDAHRVAVVEMAPACASRVSRLIPDSDIADPAGATEDEYETCARRIEEGLRLRLEEVMA